MTAVALSNERRLRAAQRVYVDATLKAEAARKRRAETIRECWKDGMKMREIAEVVGINHQRVSQIVNGTA